MTTATVTAPPISPRQLAALHAAARRRGLSRDDLHALAGVESLKYLSAQQAGELLDSLNRGTLWADRKPKRPPRRPKGVYKVITEAQRLKIAALCAELSAIYQWTPQRVKDFLAARHFRDGRPMTEPLSNIDGQDVIKLLNGILVNIARGVACSRGTPREHANAEAAP